MDIDYQISDGDDSQLWKVTYEDCHTGEANSIHVVAVDFDHAAQLAKAFSFFGSNTFEDSDILAVERIDRIVLVDPRMTITEKGLIVPR
jgi:hypothetical protein